MIFCDMTNTEVLLCDSSSPFPETPGDVTPADWTGVSPDPELNTLDDVPGILEAGKKQVLLDRSAAGNTSRIVSLKNIGWDADRYNHERGLLSEFLNNNQHLTAFRQIGPHGNMNQVRITKVLMDAIRNR